MRTALLSIAVLAAACGGGSPRAPTAGGAGDPPPSTGTPAPPSPTGSAIIERIDPSADCDGVVPQSAPVPVDVEWASPPGECEAGTSEGSGYVALSARAGDQVTWQVFTPAGVAARSLTAWPLVPGTSGWYGLAATTIDATLPVVSIVHRTFSPDGTPASESPANAIPTAFRVHTWTVVDDPQGGSFSALGETDASHDHWSAVEGQRFDDAGRPRWNQNLHFGWEGEHSMSFLGAGVSTLGESLAIWQDAAAIDVAWVDVAGNDVAVEHRTEPYADVLGSDALEHDVQLLPLLDGGLALRSDGVLRRVVPHLSLRTAPLPSWLAGREDWTLRSLPGGRGYALLPSGGATAPDCRQQVELVSPSGKLCGRVTLPSDGGACTTGELDQGRDGTVVQQASQGSCRWRFWPGLLAR